MRTSLATAALVAHLVFATAARAAGSWSVPILLYHRFGPAADMTVPTATFEEHLSTLRQRGYTVIPLRALIEDQLDFVLFNLHNHHTDEDEWMWPRLRERSGGALPALDVLEEQHQAIDPDLRLAGDRSASDADRIAAVGPGRLPISMR